MALKHLDTELADPPDPPPQAPVPISTPSSIGKCPQIPIQIPELTTPPGLPEPAPKDQWGEITVAQPKIWQFDRVSSLLDGLLRDVEGVSLNDLTQLDPNAPNAAAVRFVQSALEVGVQYDQAAAVNTQNTLANYQAVHNSQVQQLDSYNAYMKTLTAERDSLAAQYMAVTNEVNALNALKAAGPLTDAQNKKLEEALSRQSSAQASLTSVNSLISGAGAAPTLTSPPTLTGTSVGQPASGSSMSSSLMGFSEVLKNLPPGVQTNLSNVLGNPTLPATKRLDNFITLLYERLAREVSVLQDDLMRDPENEAFLLQFDVGLYPSKKSTDHVARVQFNLDCPGCKIYSLYPGMSAYNLANYTGSSKRTTLWGNVLTLLGFGLSASYRHQVDTLQGGLVQSVYTAGFQNGAPDWDGQSAKPDHQYFGWYYGQAPAERLVTPGIRTTFAMLSVPREVIRRTKDGFGNLNACFLIDINGGWTRRDNPKFEHSYFSGLGDAAKILTFPAYLPKNDPLASHNDFTSVVSKRASVKLPADADDVPLVAQREHHKPHVIRLEYNTIYEPPPSSASATPASASSTVSTSSTSSNAPANPSPATGSSTGTSTTTTTTTTTSGAPADKAAAPPPPASTTYPNLDPLPCPKHECAPLLIRLDRQIDPNLVVTVNGIALQRVRDWRGRATSILPAAQSGSDLSTQAAADGTIFRKQLQNGRSLLETDQFEANAWFPLNARDMLLNVSKTVAQDEFPIIQISEPGGTVTIPYDLQRSTTELFINHFHIKPQTGASIAQGILRSYSSDVGLPPPVLPESAPLWSGPYTTPTFAPLFGSDPTPKKFYVQVGLTGQDLLIGFLPNPVSQKPPCGGPKERAPCLDHLNFLETHTQVILEDSELDFAWSLPCYVQDEQIACHFPRPEIARAYQSYLQACEADPSGACPALDEKYKTLKEGFQQIVDLADLSLKGEQRKVFGLDQGQRFLRQAVAEQATVDKVLPRAFVTGTQLWVEQFDPEGQQRFYSAEPTKIDFLPLSNAFWESQPSTRNLKIRPRDSQGSLSQTPLNLNVSVPAQVGNLAPPSGGLFNPWHFDSATSKEVIVKGCNYTPDVRLAQGRDSGSATQATVRILGSGLPNRSIGLDPPVDPKSDTNCGTFTVETTMLTKDSVVFVLTLPPLIKSVKDDSQPWLPTNVVMHLSTSRLKPSFGRPRIVPTFSLPPKDNVGGGSADASKNVIAVKSWDIYFPASRLASGDDFEIQCLDDHLAIPGFKCDWTPSLQTNPLPDEVNLHLYVEPKALPSLPAEIRLLRFWKNAPRIPVPVATLPNLRKLLLPTRLEIVPINDHQFALKGENAWIIGAIMVSRGDKPTTVPAAASGNGFVVAAFAAPSAKSSDQASNSSPTNGAQDSSNITVVDTKASSKITINKQNKSTPAPKEKTPAATPQADKPSAPSPLDPGSYAVTPLVIVGSTPDTAKQDKAANDLETAQATLTKAQAALKAKPNDKGSNDAVAQAQKALKQAQDTKTTADKATVPVYMPLDVTDEKGGPLIFVVLEAEKPAKDTTSTPSTPACAVPCVLAPCAATCPPAAAKPATTP